MRYPQHDKIIGKAGYQIEQARCPDQMHQECTVLVVDLSGLKASLRRRIVAEAQVTIAKNVLQLPARAIVRREGKPMVKLSVATKIVEKSTTTEKNPTEQWQLVSLGRAGDDQIEIVSGLEEGQEVYLNP